MKVVAHTPAADQGTPAQRVSRLTQAAVDNRPQAVAQRQLQQQLNNRSSGPSSLAAASNTGVVQGVFSLRQLGGYLAGKAQDAGGYVAGGARAAYNYAAPGVGRAYNYAASGVDKVSKFLAKDTPGPTGGPGMAFNSAAALTTLAGQSTSKWGSGLQAGANGYIALADVAGMTRTGRNLIKKWGDGKTTRRLGKLGIRGLDGASNAISGINALGLMPPVIKPYTDIAGPLMGMAAQAGTMRYMSKPNPNKPVPPPLGKTATASKWLSPTMGFISDTASLLGAGAVSAGTGLTSAALSTLNTFGLSQKLGQLGGWGASKAYNGYDSLNRWFGTFRSASPTERTQLV